MNGPELKKELDEIMRLIDGESSEDTFWSVIWDIFYTVFIIVAISASIASAVGIAIWVFRGVFWIMGLGEVL